MGLINIDFAATKERARQISEAGATVKRIAGSRIDSSCENIRGYWTGEGANRYYKKLNKVSSRIRKRGISLQNTASGLRNAAAFMEQLEELGKSLFS